MKDTLKTLFQNQTLCEIYANIEDTNSFSVGYVVSIDAQNCIVLAVDFYGQYDGLSCYSIDEIYKIQTNTQYLQAIEKLIKCRKAIARENYPTDRILLNMLSDINLKKRICQIELCGSNCIDATGYIKNIQTRESKIEMCLVDDFGNNNGETIIDVQMISYLSYDSTDTIRLEILNK